MDAKPQRPRGLTRIRDENMPPSNVGVSKTIHQRNKSTPALTALLKPMPSINPAQPKRSAFADVSNTIRAGPPMKDDMDNALKAFSTTSGAFEAVKPLRDTISVGPIKAYKSTTHLRPVQRPLSSLISKTSTIPLTSITSKPVVPLQPPMISAAPVRQNVEPHHATNTAIADSVVLQPITTTREPELEDLPQVREPQPSSLPTIPLPVFSTSSLNNQPLLEVSQLPGVGSQSTTSEIHRHAPMPTMLHDTEIALAGAYLPDLQDPLVKPAAPLDTLPVSENLLPALEHPTCEARLPSHIELMPEVSLPPISQVVPDALVVEKAALPAAEEYWDEDEDEEYYDAEGYTTARSFKSRGESTTNQMALLAEPRVNEQVDFELEQAARYVDRTRLDQDFEEECWDMSMVAEYSEEIFGYMRDLEEKYRPNPYYMEHQTEIQWSMRSVLVDWLTQVHGRFGMLPETLFLAVNYVDRFLSVKVVSIGKLQLVGACALFIAAKYEEISCPSVGEMVFMVDKGYTTEEILKAERFMLSMLKFECGWPGPMSFLRRISKADDYDLETRTLAKYFLEVTLMDERFVASVPSFTAAASHCLARLMLKKGGWTHAHVYYSQYTFWQLQGIMTIIVKCCREPQKHHAAIYEKYIDKKYKRAALFVEGEVRRGFEVPWIGEKTGMVDHLALLRRD